MSDNFKLDFEEQPATLRLIDREYIRLVLVGCGGTGSWLAPTVVRTARLLKEKFNKTVQVVFVDPDTVEAKNCYRQNFAEFEVGQNKAETLACRYGLAWGLDVLALPVKFEADKFDTQSRTDQNSTSYEMTVMIGCVDNPDARRELAVYQQKNYWGASRWWLDCGNSKHSAQVLLGGYNKNDSNEPVFPLPGYCAKLPLPNEQHPDLLQAQEPDAPEEAGLSCADLALRGSQGLAINQVVAAIAGDYLLQIMVYGTLTHFQTYVEMGGGNMRSTPITEGNLAKIGWKEVLVQYYDNPEDAADDGVFDDDDDENWDGEEDGEEE